MGAGRRIMKPDDLMTQPVSEFITEATSFSPTDRVAEVIGFMREHGTCEVFVEEGERTSIVTVRDLLDLTTLETHLSKLMHQVPRLNRQNNVSDAASLMFEYRIRSLPIYQAGKLIGQVTSPTIVGRMMESGVSVKLSSIMTKEPATIESNATVASARELMRRKKVDQIPILEKGRLVGVVTSDSVVFRMAPKTDREVKGSRRDGRLDESLGQYGTGSLVTNEITDSLSEVYANMHREGANYSLILNTDELQGIVTYRDCMRVLLRKTSAPQLPMYIVGLPDDPFSAAAVRTKFAEAVRLLRRGFPEISEARAVIKTGDKKSSKKRFQVDVLISSPKERYSYGVYSYEVADAFDQINDWAKRLISQRKTPEKRRQRGRRAEGPEFPPAV
jgi:CBS domain-containing protein